MYQYSLSEHGVQLAGVGDVMEPLKGVLGNLYDEAINPDVSPIRSLEPTSRSDTSLLCRDSSCLYFTLSCSSLHG
jgi:hypothetical protein